MSDYINSSSTRERTHAAKEADRQAAESSKYVPKVTIENPNRSVPAEIKNRDHSINNTDRSVKVPIFYSTISVASAFITVTVIFCVCIFVPPVPQAQSYHNFADRRSLRQLIPSLSFINIPNALDVLSNIPFLIVGLYGLYLLLTPKTIVFLTSFEKFGWIIFFISIAFVCVGSAYYHLRPYNSTLVWDRLPMTVGFSSLVGLLIDERINPILGKALFPFLLAAGFASCAYWYYRDDLRPYILVQFFPMIYIPMLLLISSSVYSHTLCYIYACTLYSLAKLSEVTDKQVFRLTLNTISGHTLKHLLAASGIAIILYMLKVRVIL
ncbi:unnamed protein product [Rotaria sp. Silwood1]|nr:unnamed protein product [Rotaria sp. Silwood1]CAF3671162.1 unnamed protein product [Rotaria sp. Silwood1]